MARKKAEKKNEAGGFSKMFAWTVVLGIVFSAGLITGQRLLRQQAMGPMVSLSSTRAVANPVETAEPGEPAAPLKTTFSFYEHLTTANAAASAAPSISTAAAKPAEAKPVEAKPAEVKPAEVKPAEVKPAEAKPAEVKPAETVAAPAPEKPAPVVAAVPVAPPSTVGEAVDTLQKAVESITQAPEGAALPARYTLQVSSHPDRDSAENELGRLRQVGVEPHVVAVDVPGKGKLFRIRVGKFHTMDEAREFQGSLKQKRGVAGFVTPL